MRGKVTVLMIGVMGLLVGCNSRSLDRLLGNGNGDAVIAVDSSGGEVRLNQLVCEGTMPGVAGSSSTAPATLSFRTQMNGPLVLEPTIASGTVLGQTGTIEGRAQIWGEISAEGERLKLEGNGPFRSMLSYFIGENVPHLQNRLDDLQLIINDENRIEYRGTMKIGTTHTYDTNGSRVRSFHQALLEVAGPEAAVLRFEGPIICQER